MLSAPNYKAIADIIKNCEVIQGTTTVCYIPDLTKRLSVYFQRDNPRFDRDKWFKYLERR